MRGALEDALVLEERQVEVETGGPPGAGPIDRGGAAADLAVADDADGALAEVAHQVAPVLPATTANHAVEARQFPS